MNDQDFVKEIYSHYRKNGRHNLPWRTPALKISKGGTIDPYRIMVSEIMLQQTQVDRVIPKYKAFLKRFPTIKVLANATLADVLAQWSGLGYNRRAKFLKLAAEKIITEHAGIFPRSREAIDALPGIGDYTAGAICAFAFNQPELFLETNIRAVYIHFFFPKKHAVTDKSILGILARTIDKGHSREWYSALMDYGTKLKGETANPTRRSKTYAKQSVFKGSIREIRGKILKHLVSHTTVSVHDLQGFSSDTSKLKQAIEGLVRDSLIKKSGTAYRLT